MQRPTSVTVFGVLNIVFGALGLVGMIFSAIALLVLPTHSTANNPVLEVMRNSPGYLLWMKITLPIGILVCGITIVAGIGLLNLKSWGRTLSVAYGIYGIVAGVLGVILNFVFIMQPLMEQASQKSGPEAAALIGGAIGGTVGGCFGMIYPVLLLIFMFRPKVVAAFRPPAQPGSI